MSYTLNQFIHHTTWAHLPAPVRQQARRCLLDTVGVALGGRQTALSAIIHEVVAETYGGKGAHLWLDGRQVSPPGAALANGMTIDALDMHDGYQPVKGHAGAALIPALLATINLGGAASEDAGSSGAIKRVSGQELLTTLVVGYEIALRAGLALHATACDYHTSGAWNALGCAAMTARRLALDADQTRHALGIAEYHGPRSQMMRCIDYPTMLKDGSGWGAMTGVTAALMARRGFTGAPALTIESAQVERLWADLGEQWLLVDQYFKPYPVCYWAQPAIAGALALRQTHHLNPATIRRVEVHAFHEATRLACRRPHSTEEAQYSLPFPVAAALVHGRVGPAEISGAGLNDAAVLAMADRIELIEDDTFNAVFPTERIERVIIHTADGAQLDSGEVRSPWNQVAPPSDEALRAKFRTLADSALPEARAAALEAVLWNCAEIEDVTELERLLAEPGIEKQ